MTLIILEIDKNIIDPLSLQISFRDNLVDFLDEIIDRIPTEEELIFLRMLVQQAPVSDLLGRFMRDILPFEQEILQKKDSFFKERNFLYLIDNDLASKAEKISHLQNLWKRDDILTEEDRETIWEWLRAFIVLGNKYKSKFGFISGWES